METENITETIIRFDELIEGSYLDQIHETLLKFVNDYTDETRATFETVIHSQFKGHDYEQMVKRMNNLNCPLSQLTPFFVSNLFQFKYPKMESEGHKFTDNEKLFFVGFCFFLNDVGTPNYPYENPLDQIKELKGFASKDFINTGFEWNMKDYLKEYQEEEKKKSYNLS